MCCFENIQSAVDTVVEVMSYGIPIARIGKHILNFGWGNKLSWFVSELPEKDISNVVI